ncbi:2Fe-2S iron-sulfur cluster binding domain-containing protein [Nocardia colli]|uniref:2Fe-2S iron-sulfur cluster binding domain-containing protein n=1 Tax=Nocardia colli TaxID=2545717 RepID=A0A5N0E0Q8_9NOCA|nr:2Fe-2S iron-sulfur cluster binding domain-containing protein [Nocardia colli]KAA8882997.1 2Fe-2S iron-sulfur cluster binding domain-containing protein [Nocardia colli]
MTPIRPLAVELRRSGRTILVPPTLTVLEALENEGVPINSMCRAGICGTCETLALTAAELRSASPPRPATELGPPSRVSQPGSASMSPRVLEPGRPNASRPVSEPGSPSMSPRVSESSSASVLGRVLEPGSVGAQGCVTEAGSPSASPRVSGSRSEIAPATEPGLPSVPHPRTGPPVDRYPRPVRLCITAPGKLTHLVLDL